MNREETSTETPSAFPLSDASDYAFCIQLLAERECDSISGARERIEAAIEILGAEEPDIVVRLLMRAREGLTGPGQKTPS